MKNQMRTITGKVRKLLTRIRELESKFKGGDPERAYGNYVRSPPVPARLIRVGTPAVSEESEGDDDLTDAKVPGRAEIKIKSGRFLHQAMLKRGIH